MVSSRLPNKGSTRVPRINGIVSLQIVDGGALPPDRRLAPRLVSHPAPHPAAHTAAPTAAHTAEWRSAARTALGAAPSVKPRSASVPARRGRLVHFSLSFYLDWALLLLVGLSAAAAGIAGIVLAIRP